MKRNCEITRFSAGDTKEHEGVTYKAVREEKLWCGGAHSIREANRAKALGGGFVLR